MFILYMHLQGTYGVHLELPARNDSARKRQGLELLIDHRPPTKPKLENIQLFQIFYQVLFGGERYEVGYKDGTKHTSSWKDAIEQRESGLYGEVDVVVLPEQSETGGGDDGETVAGIEGGETDDEAVEEGLVLVFEGYLISNVDLALSVLLLDNLYHS